jgi:hypothetical protein
MSATTVSGINSAPPSSKTASRLGVFRGSLRQSLGTCLMYLVVFEAAVLGSGQLLHLGPVTVKMLLFTVSVLYVLFALVCGDRIKNSTLLLVACYLASMAASSFIGLVHDAPLDRLGKDISPLLSFLLLPFFELTIRNEKQVTRVANCILLAAIAITSGYIYIVLSLWTGRQNYAALAEWLEPLGNGDFMFDEATQRVFYKGAIYLGVALLFLLFRRRRWAKIGAVLMILNLIAIGTRGFFLALFLTGLLYVLIGPMRATTKVALVLPVVLAGALLLPRLFLLAGDRSESNRERIVTLSQALDRTSVVSTVIGKGFGFGVPERPEHMEISYFEILYKQGVIGLCWWIGFFALLVARSRRALSYGKAELAYPFFLSSVFIALESFTNPFINNPIGMTFVTVALACLNVLISTGEGESRSASARECVVNAA